MELKDLRFAISQTGELEGEERNFLIEAYRKLFAKIYGQDMFDAFLKVTKTSSTKCENRNYKVRDLSENYERAEEALKMIGNDANLELLLIYVADKLVGAGRLKRISEVVASVPDLTIDGVNRGIEREIWKRAISFAELHFTSQGYKKMYIEIPLQEGPLLVRANDLGFKEDTDDIDKSEENRTYLLNKVLERKNDE